MKCNDIRKRYGCDVNVYKAVSDANISEKERELENKIFLHLKLIRLL